MKNLSSVEALLSVASSLRSGSQGLWPTTESG
jgi:hypothetical protein